MISASAQFGGSSSQSNLRWFAVIVVRWSKPTRFGWVRVEQPVGSIRDADGGRQLAENRT